MKIFKNYFEFEHIATTTYLDTKILNIGHNVHPANTQYPDLSHPDKYFFEWVNGRCLTEYQIIYILKGEGHFESYGQKPILIESGTIILLYPGLWHRYRPTENIGWEEYWVGFTGNYAQFFFESSYFSPLNPIIKVGFNNDFINTFSKLEELIEKKENSLKKLAPFLIVQILGIIYSKVLDLNSKKTKKDKLIYSMLDYIHENWEKNIDFEKLSQSQNVSYAWFRKSFKEILGTSPNQYQIMIKIKKAQQLIQDTSLTLGEIAYQVGFKSEFYFSRIFKQKMKYNASSLRKWLPVACNNNI